MHTKLRELRIKNGYSVRTMGEKLGISKAFYSQIETGKRRLSYAMAYKISCILDMKPDAIFLDEYRNLKEL